MTFYAIFPLMIMATVKPRVFLSVLAFSFLIYCYFAFFVLSNEFTLAEQWNIYINPLNQSFLFASGIAIGWFRDNSRNPSQVGVWVIGAVSLLFMMFYPASGNQINIVAGINRILFTVFCIGLCYSAINCNIEKDLVLTKILKFFGDISYSLYLLHSVVGVYFLQLVLPKIGQFSPMAKLYILFLVVLPSIIFISFLIYRFIEIPFMKMGKRLAVVRGDKTAGVYNLGKLRDGY
ncbi:hypothetical protein L861_01965 [Litchfieldella anticariensis FP35 = DSM 16096]|uniref:Acyltransferase 3 domain-containing protein n=2 Tax=Litchfieldella anticariensis TaxID=258591 RepID=S2KU53_LITA3|nr:hypothetical protein L861_01965 [Halomonas anticariensis FP35 = DSM 16096]